MFAFSAALPLPSRRPYLHSRCPAKRPNSLPACQQESTETLSSSESSAMAAAAATLILKKAATTYINGGRKPDGKAVSQALRQLEKEQKKNKIKSDLELLYGQWRLVFTADEKTKNPFLKAVYFPLRAHQSFFRDCPTGEDGIFDNGVFLSATSAFFRIRGPFRWVPPRNRMEFTVDELQVKLGPWEWTKNGLDKEGPTLEGRTAKTLPFFTFFTIRNDILCARGRSGGLALYARVPDDQYL